jgi:hypothetical protein
VRVAADQATSGSKTGRAGFAGFACLAGRERLPLSAENPRIMLATPVARSPAPVASRTAVSGVGFRMAAIARQSGQTQHSALPVAQPAKPGPNPRPPVTPLKPPIPRLIHPQPPKPRPPNP